MILHLLFIHQIVAQINECKKAHDNALSTIQFMGSPGFPRFSRDSFNCKYTVSVNYGVWIKLSGDVIDIPCVGANGIYIEEKGGRAGPFCSKKKMPAFVSRDVFFDIHIVIDTPLAPGWRVKIGYKQLKAAKGPNLPSSKGKRPPPIMNSMDLPDRRVPTKMAPDQGQGLLQQTNKQNSELMMHQASQGQIFVDQAEMPQEFDQKQPQNMRNNPVEIEPAGGGRGGGGGGRGRPKLKSANKRTWESDTWNGDKEPVFKTLGKPKVGLEQPKEDGGGGIIMAVILLIILICVAIFLVHKRQQMIKEQEKKQDEEVLKAQEASGTTKPAVKTDTFKPEPVMDTKPTEPTLPEINACVEHATKNMTESKDSGCVEEKQPKRTTSEESVGKESQATTAPSISEYPKPPERKKRTGIRGPPGQ